MEIIISPSWEKFVEVYNTNVHNGNNGCYESIRAKFNIPINQSLHSFYNTTCDDKEKREIFIYMKHFDGNQN